MKRYLPVIMATCVVPWNDRLKFDETLFRKQVRILRERLTKHLYIFGTAGEGYAVSNRQFECIAKVFWEETNNPDTYPLVGIISLSLPTIIERIELGRQIGFRAFQISLPSWGPLTDPELDNFFREICGRFPDCQFLHYNLMRTKRLLGGPEYARLSAAHPNLVAVKVGSEDTTYLADLMAQAPALQLFLTEFGYALMRDRHECGLLISLAATNFEAAHEFFQARGRELAQKLEELRQVAQVLDECVGKAGHMDGLFDKMLYKLHASEFPLRLMPPYEAATEEVFRCFAERLPAQWRPC